MNPHFLQPHAPPKPIVQQIPDHATERTRHKVEKAKNRRIIARLGLAEVLEVFQVICAKDGIDGEFTAKAGRVGCHEKRPVDAEADSGGLAEGGFHDSFALGGLDGFGAGEVDFMREAMDVTVRDGGGASCVGGNFGFFWGFGVGFLLVGGGRRGGRRAAVGNTAGDGDDGVGAGKAVGFEVLLHSGVAVVPFAHGGVFAEEEKAEAADDEAHEGYHKGYPPGAAGRMAKVVDERVVHGGHDEVGDTAAGVTPTARERVGRADYVLVEPSRAPDLAGHEGPAENADKEANDVKTVGIADQRRQSNGDAAR